MDYGTCEICGAAGKRRPGSFGTSLVRDHDHMTGKYRGLLCQSCNAKEGNTLYAEDPVFVEWRKRGIPTYMVPIYKTWQSPRVLSRST